MKTQLLQDLDESGHDFVARPVGLPKAPQAASASPERKTPPPDFAPPAPAPAPAPSYAPKTPPAGAPRAGVWSTRDRAAAFVQPPQAAPEPAKPAARPAPVEEDDPAMILPQATVWPSQQAAALAPEPRQQNVRRWARISRWGLALIALTACIAGGLWIYQEMKIDSTLSLLAPGTAHAPAIASVPAPPVAPVIPPDPAPPVAASIGSEALQGAPATQTEAAGAPEAPVSAPVPATPVAAVPAPAASVAAPAATQQRTASEELVLLKPTALAPALAPAAPAQAAASRHSIPSANPVPRQHRREPVEAAHVTPAHRTASPADSDHPGKLAEMPVSKRASIAEETLRQCRAMGYHQAQCIERGCYTTKFGLVCKG